ncbi:MULTISPECIES: IclR family transcriptional regulator [Thermomonospora]|uniref:DNA-binding IclR family transcriptional regulator n=1 Tax=Thermomonospora cellulosilytica TaxID=1411118 RepID=A0A7W3N2Q5_9ACTN|nr:MULTISPECIES: IclR family transcriptional regulator [Thermomonospora]MBA9006367.1 DNA-binding IclR family transcriptional regulator [Thermomonospora cellulosilytica]
MAGGAREPGRSVTSKVLAVLGAFDAAHPRLTLTDLARRSGLPLSTAHRLVAELVDAQVLSRAPDGRLRVGMRLWELGQLATGRLHEAARPWLQELFTATGENVHVAVRDGLEVLYVDKVYGRRAVPIVSRTGGRLPMHPTGVGKVLLAHEPDWFVTAYLARELERPTPYTITEPGRLARELDAVRDRGYALTHEEMTLGSCSAAVPVTVDGRVVAALGIVLSSRRSRELPRLIEPLRTTAAAIARGCASLPVS